MGRLHDWFFNNSHEKCKAEIVDLKKTIKEQANSFQGTIDTLHEEVKNIRQARDSFHTAYNGMMMHNQSLMQENAALVAALAEKEPTKHVTPLEHNLMELLAQSNKTLLEQ